MADEAARDFGPAAAAAQRLGPARQRVIPGYHALIPVPESASVDTLDDASLPLSFGVGRLTPLTAELWFSPAEAAAAPKPAGPPRAADRCRICRSYPNTATTR